MSASASSSSRFAANRACARSPRASRLFGSWATASEKQDAALSNLAVELRRSMIFFSAKSDMAAPS